MGSQQLVDVRQLVIAIVIAVMRVEFLRGVDLVPVGIRILLVHPTHCLRALNDWTGPLDEGIYAVVVQPRHSFLGYCVRVDSAMRCDEMTYYRSKHTKNLQAAFQ